MIVGSFEGDVSYLQIVGIIFFAGFGWLAVDYWLKDFLGTPPADESEESKRREGRFRMIRIAVLVAYPFIAAFVLLWMVSSSGYPGEELGP